MNVESTPSDSGRTPAPVREPADPFVAEEPVSAEAPIDRRMQALKSALTADAERNLPEIVPSMESNAMRLRVEGLLHKARELLTAGQLTEARRATKQAVDLSSDAALEFLPNEDRPGDLLRQIDDRLSAASAPPREAIDKELANVGAPVPFALPLPAATESNSAALTLPEIATTFSAGSVTANQPFSVRSPLADRASDATSTNTNAPVTNPSDANAGSEEHVRLGGPEDPLSIPSGPDWSSPVLDEGLPPSPAIAPSPPIVDEVVPMPRFGAGDSVGRPMPALAASTRGGGRHWMDWMPVGVLAVVLAVCGAALGVRRWRRGV